RHAPSSHDFPYATLFRSPAHPPVAGIEAGDIDGEEAAAAHHAGECKEAAGAGQHHDRIERALQFHPVDDEDDDGATQQPHDQPEDRKSTRLNSSHVKISY